MKPSALFLVASQFISTGLKFAVFVLFSIEGGLHVAGAYTLALAVVTPVFLLFKIGLREIYVTSDENALVFQRVMALRLLYGFIAVLAAVVIAAVIFPDSVLLVLLMSFYRYAEVLCEIVVAYYQREADAFRMALVNISFSILTIGSMGAVFVITGGLLQSILAATISGLAVYFVAMVLSKPWQVGISTIPSWFQVRETFTRGINLSLSSFAVSLSTNTPVLFIEYFHSSDQVGLYSVIYHITTVTNILYSSVAQLELRGFARAVHDGAYRKLTQRWRLVTGVLTLAGACGAILIAFFGVEVFNIIFDYDFADAYPALLVMGAVVCLTPAGFILDAQLVALQKYSVQFRIAILALFVTVGVSFVLIPPYSVFGGVTAILATLVLRNIIKYFVVAKEVQHRSDRNINIELTGS